MLRNFYLDLYPYLYFYSSARWHYRSYSLAGSRRRRRHSVRGNIPGSAGSKYRHKLAYCPDTLFLAPTRGPGLVLTQKESKPPRRVLPESASTRGNVA